MCLCFGLRLQMHVLLLLLLLLLLLVKVFMPIASASIQNNRWTREGSAAKCFITGACLSITRSRRSRGKKSAAWNFSLSTPPPSKDNSTTLEEIRIKKKEQRMKDKNTKWSTDSGASSRLCTQFEVFVVVCPFTFGPKASFSCFFCALQAVLESRLFSAPSQALVQATTPQAEACRTGGCRCCPCCRCCDHCDCFCSFFFFFWRPQQETATRSEPDD